MCQEPEPMVSIVIPAFNREQFIGECLDSVISQTYKNWEALVVDDGSVDKTVDLVKEYACKDTRIKLIERDRTPKGAPTCRNIGLSNANGFYIIFLDSDDILAKQCLQNRIDCFGQHPELDFIVYPTRLFNNHVGDLDIYWNKPVADRDDLTRFMDFDTPWQTSGPIWKKLSVKKLGGFDEEALSAQDWEFHIRAIIFQLRYLVIDDLHKADVFYRRHESAISRAWLEKDKILNRVCLLDRIYKQITGRISVTKEMKRCYAGIYFRLSVKLIYSYEHTIGLHTFREIRKHQLLPDFEYYFWLICVLTQKEFIKSKQLQKIGVWLFDSMGYRLLGYQFNSGSNRNFLKYHWTSVE